MERVTGTHRLRGRMTTVGPGVADTELSEQGMTLASRLAFQDEATFREEGTIDFGNGDRMHFRSVGSGTLCLERSTGLRRGTSVLEVDGGSGRLASARGRITSSFVVADDGAVVDERFVDVFIETEEEEHHD